MAVITVSRQFGSGGTEIAVQVCEMLGYRYLDKVLLTEVAAEAGLSGKELVNFAEARFELAGLLDRLLRPGPHSMARAETRPRGAVEGGALSVEQLDEARCAKLVRGAIHAAYQQGNVVIMGRGGQITLREMPNVLHLRIVAPMGARILRIQEKEGVVAEVARRLAIEHDQATTRYLNQLFGVRGDEPELYHMVLNTGKCSPEAAVQIIANAVAQVEAGI